MQNNKTPRRQHIEENLDGLGHGDAFVEKTPERSMKEIRDNLHIIKIKHFCPAKDNVE